MYVKHGNPGKTALIPAPWQKQRNKERQIFTSLCASPAWSVETVTTSTDLHQWMDILLDFVIIVHTFTLQAEKYKTHCWRVNYSSGFTARLYSALLPQLQSDRPHPWLACRVIRLGADQPGVISPPVWIISHYIWFKALLWWCCWGEEEATRKTTLMLWLSTPFCEFQDQIIPGICQNTWPLQTHVSCLTVTHCCLILVNPVSMLEWIY